MGGEQAVSIRNSLVWRHVRVVTCKPGIRSRCCAPMERRWWWSVLLQGCAGTASCTGHGEGELGCGIPILPSATKTGWWLCSELPCWL